MATASLPPICENLPFLLSQAEASCKTNFYSSGFNCIGNQCTCQNGLPETEHCETHLSENCNSCNTGFYLNDGFCDLTQCTCQNGLPDTENCDSHLSEKCASCNAGYYLNDFFGYLNNGICSLNQCTCQNGVRDTENCETNLSEDCDSCNTGYYLNDGFCTERACTCENGSGTVGEQCITDGDEVCAACDAGYELISGLCDVYELPASTTDLPTTTEIYSSIEYVSPPQQEEVDDALIEAGLDNTEKNLAVTLIWQDRSCDMDLHVIEPSGFEIYWETVVSPSGGLLDHDDGGNDDGIAIENISWDTAPSGDFKIAVTNYDECDPAVHYTLYLWIDGEVTVFNRIAPADDDTTYEVVSFSWSSSRFLRVPQNIDEHEIVIPGHSEKKNKDGKLN